MILNVNNAEFVNLAKTVTKNVGKDQSSQLILDIRDNNVLNLSYCSPSCILSGDMHFSSESYETMKLCLSGVQLKTIAGLILVNEAPIKLEISDDKNVLTIRTDTSDFRVPIIDTPIVDFKIDIKEHGSVNGNEFIKIVNDLSKLIPSDVVLNNHPASCLNIIAKDNVLRLVSTNTFGLVEKTMEYSGKDFNVLLKPLQVATLMNTFNVNEPITLIKNGSKFGFYNSDNILHLVSTVNLEPLKYDAFKTTAMTERSFTTDINSFKYGIQAMMKLSPDSNQIWLKLNDNKIEFKNTNNDTTDIDLDSESGDVETVIEFGAQTLSILSNYIDSKIRVYYGSNTGNQVLKIESLKKDKESDEYVADENMFIATGVSVMHV